MISFHEENFLDLECSGHSSPLTEGQMTQQTSALVMSEFLQVPALCGNEQGHCSRLVIHICYSQRIREPRFYKNVTKLLECTIGRHHASLTGVEYFF